MHDRFSVVVAIALLVAALLSGCASVRSLDQDGNRRGFEYFPAKPYLLVETTKEGPRARVITLPDVTRPRYIRHKGGWGSVEFSFEMAGGMLTSFNQAQDSKGPETIAAVGAVASGIGSVVGAAGVTGTTVVRKNIQELATELNTKVVQPLSGHPDDAVQRLAAGIGTALGVVQTEATLTLQGDEDIAKTIAESDKKIRVALSKISPETKALADLAAKENADAVLVMAHRDLERILASLRAATTATQDVRMYEIVPSAIPGKIEFNPVGLSTPK
ncbi:MAG: hypothetical protein AAF957_06745 [Planctomycetota bacterium]